MTRVVERTLVEQVWGFVVPPEVFAPHSGAFRALSASLVECDLSHSLFADEEVRRLIARTSQHQLVDLLAVLATAQQLVGFEGTTAARLRRLAQLWTAPPSVVIPIQRIDYFETLFDTYYEADAAAALLTNDQLCLMSGRIERITVAKTPTSVTLHEHGDEYFVLERGGKQTAVTVDPDGTVDVTPHLALAPRKSCFSKQDSRRPRRPEAAPPTKTSVTLIRARLIATDTTSSDSVVEIQVPLLLPCLSFCFEGSYAYYFGVMVEGEVRVLGACPMLTPFAPGPDARDASYETLVGQLRARYAGLSSPSLLELLVLVISSHALYQHTWTQQTGYALPKVAIKPRDARTGALLVRCAELLGYCKRVSLAVKRSEVRLPTKELSVSVPSMCACVVPSVSYAEINALDVDYSLCAMLFLYDGKRHPYYDFELEAESTAASEEAEGDLSTIRDCIASLWAEGRACTPRWSLAAKSAFLNGLGASPAHFLLIETLCALQKAAYVQPAHVTHVLGLTRRRAEGKRPVTDTVNSIISKSRKGAGGRGRSLSALVTALLAQFDGLKVASGRELRAACQALLRERDVVNYTAAQIIEHANEHGLILALGDGRFQIAE